MQYLPTSYYCAQLERKKFSFLRIFFRMGVKYKCLCIVILYLPLLHFFNFQNYFVISTKYLAITFYDKSHQQAANSSD